MATDIAGTGYALDSGSPQDLAVSRMPGIENSSRLRLWLRAGGGCWTKIGQRRRVSRTKHVAKAVEWCASPTHARERTDRQSSPQHMVATSVKCIPSLRDNRLDGSQESPVHQHSKRALYTVVSCHTSCPLEITPMPLARLHAPLSTRTRSWNCFYESTENRPSTNSLLVNSLWRRRILCRQTDRRSALGGSFAVPTEETK